jgi:nucleotide-binding universal stress UspA family protein
MGSSVLLCTDGSDEALRALSVGVDLLGDEHDFVLVTVADVPDEESLVGSGHAGAALTPSEYDEQVALAGEAAANAVREAQNELSLVGAEVNVLGGDAGPAICQLATELSARAIVIGSRGRGGLKRALLGSVSDHIVRNAPCSVVVTRI